jgi:endonuclease/exonuclease/phosphatase family metal-dependent hydrolase
MGLFRRFTKRFFVIINILVAIPFLLACLNPFFSTIRWWPLGFAGLAFPYLLVIMLLFLFFWLIVKPIWSLLPLGCLLLALQQMAVLLAWNFTANFKATKPEGTLRIVSWNVGSFNGNTTRKEQAARSAAKIAASAQEDQPDLLCLQEFNHSTDQNNIALFSGQYPYHYFSADYQSAKKSYQSGCIIFSKFPIINSGKTAYPAYESLIFADILYGKDTLRIYTTHLQSFKFKPADYEELEKLKNQEKEAMVGSKSLVKKMKLAYNRRNRQANIAAAAIAQCVYPYIICGDFNDTPNSYTYFTLRGKAKDAFLEKGAGLGKTFLGLAPTLRIDYILHHPLFSTQQFLLVDENLSDHAMLKADLKLNAPGFNR